MSSGMELSQAVRLVALDRGEGEDIHTVEEAVAHAIDVLHLPEDQAVAGGYPIEEDGSQTAQAYRLVLEAGRHTSAAEIAKHAGAGFSACFAIEHGGL